TVDQRPEARRAGRFRLVVLLVLLPVLIGLGVLLGRGLAGPLGRLDPKIQLAEHLHAYEMRQAQAAGTPSSGKGARHLLPQAASGCFAQKVPGTFSASGPTQRTIDAVEAFRVTKKEAKACYSEALAQQARLNIAGMALGGWVGLVFGVKLLALSIRRRRTDYDVDPANCVSCGRCFKYCPKEQLRLGLIREEDLPTRTNQETS
ncbi:MAG: 4Fe-4S binding protein, partial [Pirellulales bacterium]|nr:4Fe-4S binding protein [Pirellulales bacterium]